MRLLVTGGTGFIGSHFIRAALSQGHEVVALKGRTPPLKSRVEDRVDWVECRLDSVPDACFDACEAVIHFAAQGVSPQPTDWATAADVNVLQSLIFCSQAESHGVPHIVACGSCFEYGRSGARYPEIPVDAPLEPVGAYAASKAAFTIAFAAMARESAGSYSLLRPFHLYGEGQHESNFWPSLRRAAESGENFPMTAGEQVRDYMPVLDAAKNFLRALEFPPPPGSLRLSNIGSGVPVTMREFATKWWNSWGARGKIEFGAIPYREGEVMRFVPKLDPIDQLST